jgi:ribosomal protein S18 acetylase RimI-like enzyme
LFPNRYVRAVASHLWFVAALNAGFDRGRVWCLADRTAVGVWFPPGATAELQGPAERWLRVLVSMAGGAERRRITLERALHEHRPIEQHWHLAAVGTEIHAQGQGRGRAVLEPGLDVCDSEKVLAYLETSEARSVSFYARLGFSVRSEIRAGTAPHVWCMVRTPRP